VGHYTECLITLN